MNDFGTQLPQEPRQPEETGRMKSGAKGHKVDVDTRFHQLLRKHSFSPDTDYVQFVGACQLGKQG
jgi:hypothetical protein